VLEKRAGCEGDEPEVQKRKKNAVRVKCVGVHSCEGDERGRDNVGSVAKTAGAAVIREGVVVYEWGSSRIVVVIRRRRVVVV